LDARPEEPLWGPHASASPAAKFQDFFIRAGKFCDLPTKNRSPQ
jgi:hypothetical protein